MSLLSEYPQLKIIQDIARQKKVSIYLVGGFLRDFLLGSVKEDFDLAENDTEGIKKQIHDSFVQS